MFLYCSLLDNALPAEFVQASRCPDMAFSGYELLLLKMPKLKFLNKVY